MTVAATSTPRRGSEGRAIEGKEETTYAKVMKKKTNSSKKKDEGKGEQEEEEEQEVEEEEEEEVTARDSHIISEKR